MATKRQHLIWRKYLAPWTDSPNNTKGTLFCLDSQKGEIRRDSIVNLGVQNYAYDISMMNESDKKIVIQYYDKYLNNKINSLKCCLKFNEFDEILQRDFLENSFISPIENQGLLFLKDLYNHKFPFDSVTELESIKKNLEECLINVMFDNADEKEIEGLLRRSE